MVSFLDPRKIPVIAADQPIYATAKHSLIQCYWADNYGEDEFVILVLCLVDFTLR